MPRQKLYHHYFVVVNSYATIEVKERVQTGRELITDPAQISAQAVYSGSDERQAAIKFYQAVKMAMTSDLAFSVIVWRDSTIIARVRLDH
jgi:hypothetical protein